MRELLIAKRIALSIEHIKVSRKEKGQKDNDNEVAEALNSVGSAFPGWETVRTHRFTEFRHGRDRGKLGEHALILQALEALLRSANIHISFVEMERRYGHKLPPLLLQSASTVFKGEELGDVAEVFQGAWRFFYLSPIDRQKRPNPEFRAFGVFVTPANRASRTADFFAISGRSRWEGEAFVNQSHIYLMCSDVNRTEAAFFLTSKPKKDEPFLTGIGGALERDIDRATRPALGFVCFGEKWSPNHTDVGAPQRANKESKATDSMIERIILRAMDGEQIARHEEEALRRHFCRRYTMAELRKDFPDLTEHLKALKVNGKADFERTWVYLEWPD